MDGSIEICGCGFPQRLRTPDPAFDRQWFRGSAAQEGLRDTERKIVPWNECCSFRASLSFLYLESLLRPCDRCALLLKSGSLHSTAHIGSHLRDLSRQIAFSKTELPLTLSDTRFSVWKVTHHCEKIQPPCDDGYEAGGPGLRCNHYRRWNFWYQLCVPAARAQSGIELLHR